MLRRCCSRSVQATAVGARLLYTASDAHPASLAHSYQPRTTSFGFREVPEEEKERLVGNVFTTVASKYDLMNDIMSGGLHRLWKDRLVSKLSPFPGMQHLDVAGGTGDVAFRVLDAVYRCEQSGILKKSLDLEADDDTRVHVCDINPAMLEVGKQRAKERGEFLSWLLTLISKSDTIVKQGIVLRRGGHFLCSELSHVENLIFKQLYDFYSFSIIPSIGDLVANDKNSYQYLVESIRKFPRQKDFALMIQQTGFQKVDYENLVGGVVSIHSGFKL
ncbi:hypothetical protein L7F22_018388 [Adiantum nelumboides]|nr:hypothetical protein [Adiantum nelumboides]